jgi:hypothetical protein
MSALRSTLRGRVLGSRVWATTYAEPTTSGYEMIDARADVDIPDISQTVKDLVAGSGLMFEPAGEYGLNGVPGRLLYGVDP